MYDTSDLKYIYMNESFGNIKIALFSYTVVFL